MPVPGDAAGREAREDRTSMNSASPHKFPINYSCGLVNLWFSELALSHFYPSRNLIMCSTILMNQSTFPDQNFCRSLTYPSIYCISYDCSIIDQWRGRSHLQSLLQIMFHSNMIKANLRLNPSGPQCITGQNIAKNILYESNASSAFCAVNCPEGSRTDPNRLYCTKTRHCNCIHWSVRKKSRCSFCIKLLLTDKGRDHNHGHYEPDGIKIQFLIVKGNHRLPHLFYFNGMKLILSSNSNVH